MKRTLTVTITADVGNVETIEILDHESGDKKEFYVGGYNTTDEKAMEIGYELISWAEMEHSKLMDEMYGT